MAEGMEEAGEVRPIAWMYKPRNGIPYASVVRLGKRTEGTTETPLYALPAPATTEESRLRGLFAALKAAIHDDPEYAWAWHCNLAVPIMDAANVAHLPANQAAALIMAQMFDYDITTHPYWEGPKASYHEYYELRVAAERAEASNG